MRGDAISDLTKPSARLTAWPAAPRSGLERAWQALWVLYLGCYPFAVVGVAFDVRAGFSMAWAGSVVLFLEGALGALWLVRRLGARRGGLAAGAVALGAAVMETLGVASGFPFGPYRYTDVLFPRLPGGVPVPVIGAWLLVVAAASGAAEVLLPEGGRATRALAATVVGVALDLVLEPVAVYLEGYWAWLAGGPYYGIPTENFVGWAVLCALFAGLVQAAWGAGARRGPTRERSGAWLAALTAGMFGLIDLTHGFGAAAAIAGAILVALASRWRAGYDTR